MKDYDIEAMLEILSEHDIKVSFETAQSIAESFIDCYLGNREGEGIHIQRSNIRIT